MDQVRLITAIVLSVIIFAVWNYIYAPKPQQPPETVSQPQQQAIDTTSSSVKPMVKPSVNQDIPESTPQKPEQIKLIETPLYKIKISDRGAVLKSIKLKKYNETNEKDSPLFDILDSDKDINSATLNFADKELYKSSESTFSSNISRDYIRADKQLSVEYKYVSDSGIILKKIYTFYPETYLIDIDVSVINKSNETIRSAYALAISDSIPDSSSYSFQGPTAKIGNSIEEIKIKKIKKKDTYTGNIQWIAIQDRYFINILLPAHATDNSIMKLIADESTVTSAYKFDPGFVEPGQKIDLKFHHYAGPKKISILKSTGELIGKDTSLDDTVSFGWFDIVAKPCLFVMNFIYNNILANYGVAIIILTIIIKIFFWPLANKSYKSMAEMKKLQPVIAELREKYKGDSKKMNQEMMNLYKVYKVNPFSGCFPLIIQMPIFIALYQMLYSAIELRHAPFALWITDLSAPERLFDFGISIPFMEPPIGIPVLTIIMGLTMFLQQKMSPPAGDPAQARIMMLMPLFLMVIFINFSSGLVLYWLVNNVLSIAQQYYINKKLA